MSDLCFGYASFVGIISERGYIFQSHEENRITFWLTGLEPPDIYESFQVKGNKKKDCGYVVINTFVLEKRFEDDKTGLVDFLLKKCVRARRIIENDKNNNNEQRLDLTHCKEPGYETTLYDGETVECLLGSG